MTDTAQPSDKLSKKHLFFYSLSEMPIQVAAVPVAAFIPNYYGADLGMSLVVVANVWLIARLFDGIIDPLIGYFSDKTDTKWGRRRVWMVAAVPIMMIAVYKVFFPEPPVSASYLLLWMVVFWTGWTMLLIPYYAWAAELSPDYHERSLITGWRAWIGMAANVLSKLIPVIALYFFGFGGTPAVVFMIGIILLILLPTTVGLTVSQVPERTDAKPVQISVLKGARIMMKNGPFRRLVSAFFASYIGIAFATATIVFYIRGVLEHEGGSIVMLLFYFSAGLCGVPFWIWLSKQIGKHKAWVASLLVYPVFSPFYLLLGPGDFYWMLPIAAITGFAGGAFHALPNSMKADVIDLDEMRTGENRAATFFAVWSFTMKMALSFGPWLALIMLAWVGFDAAPGAENAPENLLGLSLIYALSPPIFFTIAAILALRYPITEERHKRMRSALERRRERRAAPQPAE
jgi:Na+/melibiose symporter-like transporter